MVGVLRYQTITIESLSSAPLDFKIGSSTRHLVPPPCYSNLRVLIDNLNKIPGHSHTCHAILLLVLTLLLFCLVFVISFNSPKHIILASTVSVLGMGLWSGLVIQTAYSRQRQKIQAVVQRSIRIFEPWFSLTRIRTYFRESKKPGFMLFTYPSYRISLKLKKAMPIHEIWNEFVLDLQEPPIQRQKPTFDQFGLPKLTLSAGGDPTNDYQFEYVDNSDKTELYFQKLRERSKKRSFWKNFIRAVFSAQTDSEIKKLMRKAQIYRCLPEQKKRNFLDDQLLNLSDIWAVADQSHLQNLKWLDQHIRKLEKQVRKARQKKANGGVSPKPKTPQPLKKTSYIRPTGNRKRASFNHTKTPLTQRNEN